MHPSMHPSQREQLRQQSYGNILILRILIGLIRFVFDIPAFLGFLVTGKVEPKTHR